VTNTGLAFATGLQESAAVIVRASSQHNNAEKPPFEKPF
jgi:hypothetical protein